ncbi:MAG: hypothetical protein E7434_09170 [Ruminococcaceae bacterium]|nr:hypothetical protein [Oscillospiraceae bacterium]
MDIYENGRKIGILHMEEDGLYSKITCKCEPSKSVRRIYLAYPYAAQYLGIPDANGFLEKRIASKKLPKQFCAVAAVKTDAHYLPWRGMIDGIMVEDAMIAPEEIAIALDETMNFPSWKLETKLIHQKEMAVIPLNDDGLPQPIEREAIENETLDFDDPDYDMPSELPAADGEGGEEWEADRPDL